MVLPNRSVVRAWELDHWGGHEVYSPGLGPKSQRWAGHAVHHRHLPHPPAGGERRAIGIMRHAIEHVGIGHGIMLGLGTRSSERFMLGVFDALIDVGQSQPVTSAQTCDRVCGRLAFRKSDRVMSVLRMLEEHRLVRLFSREGRGPKSNTVLRNPPGSGCEHAEMAVGTSGGDVSTPPSWATFASSHAPFGPGTSPLLPMKPTEFLEPTGTEESGVRPGEILL